MSPYLLTFFVAGTICTIRMVLIIAGVYKDPVLATFEAYGPDEKFYSPMPLLLVGVTGMIFGGGGLFVEAFDVRLGYFLVVTLSLMTLSGSVYLYQHPDMMHERMRFAWHYPRWYARLRERTTRAERRHLAYMWHYLPGELRRCYNSSDYAFWLWADLVIMSTIHP